MQKYTVKQLANLAGISVRTLHYYDEIGLLKPSQKTKVGYRVYLYEDLLRLQQIMFFKELGLTLEEIKKNLDDPAFDLQKSLVSHRREITKRMAQFEQLIQTIDKTLLNLNQKIMLSDEEMYKGFTS